MCGVPNVPTLRWDLPVSLEEHLHTEVAVANTKVLWSAGTRQAMGLSDV